MPTRLPEPIAIALTALAALALAACAPPEARTARTYLRCLAERDTLCLLRFAAPVVPRLRAWAASPRADDLYIGAYARQVLRRAGSPYAALSPDECQTHLSQNAFDAAARDALSSCDCDVVSRRELAPRKTREALFEPQRKRAEARHPALEVLANRTTAEALRVTTLTRVRCACDGRAVDVGIVDMVGREPPWHVFFASGACAAPSDETTTQALDSAHHLLSGDLHDR
jgi:hypothetical protein